MVPSWTETLIQCGIEVVGRTRYCIHPADKIKSIPVVGGTKDFSLEKIKALGADFLILDREENPKIMANSSPIPFISSHVTCVDDVARDLKIVGDALETHSLQPIIERWQKIALKKTNTRELISLPGVLEWLKKPSVETDLFIYLIWRDPWMAASPDTFIGSVLEKLGFGPFMVPFDQKYPVVNLSKYDPEKTLLVFSSEPYPFHKKKKLLSELPNPAVLVDGESFSWFGSRALEFLEKNTV